MLVFVTINQLSGCQFNCAPGLLDPMKLDLYVYQHGQHYQDCIQQLFPSGQAVHCHGCRHKREKLEKKFQLRN